MSNRNDALSDEFWILLATVAGVLPGRRVEAQRQWERLCLPVLEELALEELGRTPLPTGPLHELPLNVVQTALPKALEEAGRLLWRYRLADLRAGQSAARLLGSAVRWAVGEWTRNHDGDAFHGQGPPAARGAARGDEPTWAALPPVLPPAARLPSGGRPEDPGRETAHRRPVLLPAAEAPDLLHFLLPDPAGTAVLGVAPMFLRWRRVAGASPEAPGEAGFWTLAIYLPSLRADPALGNEEGSLRPLTGRGARLECYVAGRERPEQLLTRLDLDPSRSLVSMPRICRIVTPTTLQSVCLALLDEGARPV